MDTDMRPLVVQMWQTVESLSDLVTGRKIAMPAVVATQRRPNEARFSADFPVLTQLDTALSLASGGPLAELAGAISADAANFLWSQNASYDDSNCSRSFLDGYAYAGLSGPDAALSWAAPRTGVMLMGSHVLYPGHNHAAREIYMLLTPGTEWRLDGGDWFEVAAGSLIFHDSWQMHEMRTRDLPMLAVAAWLEDGDRTSIQWDKARMAQTE